MDERDARQMASLLARPTGEQGLKVTTELNEMNAFITARALEALSLGAGERMLEIGPGNGRLSQEAAAALGDS